MVSFLGHDFLTQTEIVGERAGGAAEEGYQVHIDALRVQEHVEFAFALTRNIVQEINRLVIGLETGTGEKKKVFILLGLIGTKCQQSLISDAVNLKKETNYHIYTSVRDGWSYKMTPNFQVLIFLY